MGVDLFFVLSGFLISGLLFQEYKDTGSINFKRFLIRRGFKIYPSFYLLIAMAATCLSFLNKHSELLRGRASSAAVFTRVVPSKLPSRKYLYTILAHTWSLAVEEHFYLLLPPPLLLPVLAIARQFENPSALFRFQLCLPFSWCCALRFAWFTLAGFDDALIVMTHMRIDSLFAGVTLGYLYYFRRASLFHKLTGHYALALALAFPCLPAAFLLPAGSRAMQTVWPYLGLLVGIQLSRRLVRGAELPHLQP